MSTIVVLEDDYTLLDLYKDVLEIAHHTVYPATTVQAVEEYFDQNTADLIIADLRVGATSAEATIHAIKQIHTRYNVPVVLISAQMMVYEEMCHDAGLTNTLTKPFPNGVLIQIAEKVIAEANQSAGS
ncbi:MAG: response regulator [Anaerolineae bacterium]